jgi:hypothetical protein
MIRAELTPTACPPVCGDGCTTDHWVWYLESGDAIPVSGDLTHPRFHRTLEQGARKALQRLGRFTASIEAIGE